MTNDLERRIDEEVAHKQRTHALGQAHEALKAARSKMLLAERLLAYPYDPFGKRITGIVVNHLEQVMWDIETEIRARGK